MMNEPTLPPVLYWSPSLAEHLNLDYEEDARHGLVDATVASLLTAYADGGWRVLAHLPDDAIRLVAEPDAGEVATVDPRIARARALHEPYPSMFPPSCRTCIDSDEQQPAYWPCATAEALGADLAMAYVAPWGAAS